MNISDALADYEVSWSTAGLLHSEIRRPNPYKVAVPRVKQRGDEPAFPVGKPVTAGKYVGQIMDYDRQTDELIFTFFWEPYETTNQ
jgi:hypothetical protein